MTENMAEAIVGKGFTEEERVRIREILKAFDGMSTKDIEEVRRIGQSGRLARTVLIVLGRIIAWVGGLVTLALAAKQLFGAKVGL